MYDNRLVQGRRGCQNCEMLRHLNSSWLRLARLWVCGAVACSSAAPIDVGVDYAEPPPPANVDPVDEAEPPASPSTIPGQTSTIEEFDAFIDLGWERGAVSPYCHSSFQACGGLLAGTWVVEDNCNPEIRSRDVLSNWGKVRMSLDETACWDAVQRLRWNWSGELRFEKGEAIDRRTRAQRVDMELTASCLSATFGFQETDSVSPEICAALADETTTCALSAGVCLCSNRTVSTGAASGVYGVLGKSVAIDANPTTEYEYCVDGEYLLWRETEGALRQVVMRRTESPPPGTMDPVEIPR
jgi:hypothetical protein